MNILHEGGWKRWVERLLIRRGGMERLLHTGGGRKRDVLYQANRHLLRDVGLSDLTEQGPIDGRR
jgi:hypothetical protein